MGIDILKKTKEESKELDEYFLIDINYFPGYSNTNP
jgi:hypothetical protein